MKTPIIYKKSPLALGDIILLLAIALVAILAFLLRMLFPVADAAIFIGAIIIAALISWSGATLLERVREHNRALNSIGDWASEVAESVLDNYISPIKDITEGVIPTDDRARQSLERRLLQAEGYFVSLQVKTEGVKQVAASSPKELYEAIKDLDMQLRAHIKQTGDCREAILIKDEGTRLMDAVALMDRDMHVSSSALYKVADRVLSDVSKARRNIMSF
jgi:hypothetical protein